MFKLKQTISGIALFGAATVLSTGAVASPFYLNVGANGFDDGITESLSQLGFNATLATSFYFGNPSVPGTAVLDTNAPGTMAAAGFLAGPQVSIAPGNPPIDITPGAPVNNPRDPVRPDDYNIDTLVALDGGLGDSEGFASGAGVFPWGTPAGNGVLWGFSYEYTLTGVTTATGVDFNTGLFRVFFENTAAGPGLEVLQLTVDGSQLDAANLAITGHVDFGWCDALVGGCPLFIQNLFNDSLTGESFYDIWAAGGDPTLAVAWRLDTNVDPPIPTANQLWVGTTGALIRQTTLDGSVTFAVPEPGSLALLGVALLGAAALRRRKS